MAEIDYSLLGDFLVEAAEHLEEMENQLLELKPGEDNKELCNNIFRPIHTIKGASQFVGLDRVSNLSHRLEDLLDLLRNGELTTTEDIVDVLIEGRDRIAALAKDLETSDVEKTPVDDLVEKVSYIIEHGGELPQELKALQPSFDDDGEQEGAGEAPRDDGLGDLEDMEEDDLDALLAEAEAAESEAGSRDDEFGSEFASELEEGSVEASEDEFQAAFAEESEPLFADEEGVADGLEDFEADDSALSGLESSEQAGDEEAGQDRTAAETSLAGVDLPEITLEEEYDQELFEIFLQQLRDKVTLVAMLSRALEGGGQDLGILEECIHHLARLRSAANYMGYETLTAYYDQWIDHIHDAINGMEDGAGYTPGFMLAQVNGLVSAVPQLREEGLAIEQDDGGFDASEYSGDLGEEAIDDSEVKDFVDQALEHLNDMEQGLLAYEQEPGNAVHLDDVFRAAHTIKGVAQFVGLSRISSVAHRMEDLLARLRQDGGGASDAVITVLMAARDRLEKLTDDLTRGGREQSAVEDVVDALDRALHLQGSTPSPEDISGDDLYGVHTREDEGADQELYQIFLNQLGEQLALIQKDIEHYQDGSDTTAALQEMEQRVRHLRHAAAYMGYEDLIKRYDGWLKELERAHFAITNGEPAPSLDGSWEQLRAIQGMFPDLGEIAKIPEQAAAPRPETAEPGRAEPEKVVPAKGEAEDVAHQKISSESRQDAAGAGGDEDELFVRLTAAMEERPAQDDREYETLHNVFEQMLDNPQEGEQATPAPAATAKPQGQAKPAAQKKGAASPASKPQAAQAKAQPSRPEPKPAPKAEAKAEPAAEKTAALADEESRGQQASPEKAERVFKKSVRVDADKIDSLMNQVGELIVDRSYFYTLYNEMHELQNHLKEDLGIDPRDLKLVRLFTYRLGEAISSLSRTSNDLQEGVMKVRMLPIAQIFNRYPRLIHDLTNRSNKRVNLVIKGEDTELDKMIVEELSDPMIHIIRNAVDHGFEPIDERKRSGKSEEGTLVVEAYQESNHIVIEVRDDGRGIDTARIKAKAMEKKLHNKDELDRMSQRDLMRLIMHPGFSTADTISRTSGRGVGMDVAKKNIEKLNGTIEVESQLGVGTQIRLKIPLTLAIIPALLVRVGADSFTIPLSNVEETLRIYDADTTTIEGTDVVHLRGRTMPIFRLSTLFNLGVEEVSMDKAFVVVVNAGSEQVGLVVDELMGQEEVVIKPLVDYLQERSGFSGATIIGDGRISLILDVYELVNMTASSQINRLRDRERLRKSGTKGKNGGKPGTAGDKAILH